MKKLHLIVLYTLIFSVIIYLVYSNIQQRHKIVYVDNIELFSGFEMKKELEKKYKETEGYRKLILDSILGELKSKAQVSNSSSTDELSMLKREFLTKKELFDKENTESMNQYNEQIWNQLNEYTAQYSKDKEYDFVFGANGQGVLMYAKDTKNVTKELLEFVNEKYNGK